ncbi:MAG TPA: recombination mediator RecR [Chitinophagaceae bacterium]|nr:recombination mediator RecR [Chitinophagaceae bacterium]
MQFSSSLLENAVNEFAKLPGIGKKTALRLVLHLLKQDTKEVTNFSEVIAKMRNEIRFCHRCFNVADGDICSICANSLRKQETICVVESIRDVIAIESTQQFNGTYHVLGGVISPLDGIGPDQLNIESLISRIQKEQTEEIIFALNPNIQGDTTIYYIQKKLAAFVAQSNHPFRITTIARGIAFGGELEYADEMTLARSLQNRLPVENYVSGR